MASIRNDRGSVLVFVTLMIVLLMIIIGMGLDTGELVYTRSMGQAAVDAAALSAVTALPAAIAKNDDSEVKSRAAAFATTNNYTGSSNNRIGNTNVSYVQYDFVNNNITNYNVALAAANGVRVALEDSSAMKTPAFLTPLMRLLGNSAVQPTNNVSVSAVSVISGRPSIPIALWQQSCQGSSTVKDMEIAQQNPANGENSCWTTYLDKSSGAQDIKSLFQATQDCTGLPVGDIDVGIPIYENKGQVASTYDVAKNFFEAYPTRCWNIPVIVGAGNCNAKDPTPIVDWAKMCYKGIFKHGSDSYIKADITCQQSINNTPDLLCYSNRLVREPAKGM